MQDDVSCKPPHSLHLVVCCTLGGELTRRLAYVGVAAGLAVDATAAIAAFFIAEAASKLIATVAILQAGLERQMDARWYA